VLPKRLQRWRKARERVKRRRARVAEEHIEKLLEPGYVASWLDSLAALARDTESHPDHVNLSNLAYRIGYIQHFLGATAEDRRVLLFASIHPQAPERTRLWGGEAYKMGKEHGRRDHKLVEAARKAERT
jgi:hypothetical protein